MDARLKDVRSLRVEMTVPAKGWIRAIRSGLGMTAAQLAARLGVAQATLSALEASEIRGSIQLATLRRAAEALDCTLVYALIPTRSLEDIVEDRARITAAAHLKPVEHSMMLEDQQVSPEARREQLSAYIRDELDPRLLWDDA